MAFIMLRWISFDPNLLRVFVIIPGAIGIVSDDLLHVFMGAYALCPSSVFSVVHRVHWSVRMGPVLHPALNPLDFSVWSLSHIATFILLIVCWGVLHVSSSWFDLYIVFWWCLCPFYHQNNGGLLKWAWQPSRLLNSWEIWEGKGCFYF